MTWQEAFSRINSWGDIIRELEAIKSVSNNLSNEDCEYPKASVIDIAIKVATITGACQANLVPDRVIPNCEGGIIFERHGAEHVFEMIEIEADGKFTINQFKDSKLIGSFTRDGKDL